jgi:acyl dehydratase
MLVHLQESIKTEPMPLDGLMMGINYGFEKVRFITPVPSGARIRASSAIKDVVLKGTSVQSTRTMTIEIEGVERPALVADWIGRFVFDS